MKPNQGGLPRFQRLHERTLRDFVAARKEEWELKRESGTNGTTLELVERMDAEPESARPRPGMSLWRAVLEAYGPSRESLAASEFPDVTADSLLKQIYKQAVDWSPVGLRFCGVDEVSKIETDAARPFLSQLPNLVEVPAGSPPPLAPLKESQFTIQVVANKLAVRVEPKLLINDDKGVFGNLNEMLLLTAKTSLDSAIALKLQTPGTSSETGQAFFSANYHLNTGTTALTRNDTGANSTLMAAWLAFVNQCDNSASISSGVRTGGKKLGLRPTMLVTAPALWPTAQQLVSNPTVLNDAGTANVANLAATLGLEAVMFDSYPDTTDWFLVGDAGRCPPLVVAFLNGRTLPTVRAGWFAGGTVLTNFLRDDGTPLYPLHIELDFPFKVNTADFRGIYGGIVAGGT